MCNYSCVMNLPGISECAEDTPRICTSNKNAKAWVLLPLSMSSIHMITWENQWYLYFLIMFHFIFINYLHVIIAALSAWRSLFGFFFSHNSLTAAKGTKWWQLQHSIQLHKHIFLARFPCGVPISWNKSLAFCNVLYQKVSFHVTKN